MVDGGGILDWHAMLAGRHFVSQILEIGYNLVISSACVMILGVRQDFVKRAIEVSRGREAFSRASLGGGGQSCKKPALFDGQEPPFLCGGR